MDTPPSAWYYLDEANQPFGPFSNDEMRSFQESSLLTLESYIWKEGMETWEPWSQAFLRVEETPDETPITEVTKVEAEPMVVARAEPAIAAKAEPAIVDKAEPTIIDKAEPTIIDKAEPTIIDKAEPTIIAKAEPTIVDKAEPAIVDKAEPAIVDKAEPAIVDKAEPTIVAKAEPAIAAKAEPAIAAKAEPAIVDKAEPTVVAKAEPAIAAKAEPVVVDKAEPTIVAKAEPAIADKTESVAVEKTKLITDEELNPATPDEPASPKAKKSGETFALAASLLLLLGIGGYVYWQIGTPASKVARIEPTGTSESVSAPAEEASAHAPASPTQSWQNPKTGESLNVPSTWIVADATIIPEGKDEPDILRHTFIDHQERSLLDFSVEIIRNGELDLETYTKNFKTALGASVEFIGEEETTEVTLHPSLPERQPLWKIQARLKEQPHLKSTIRVIKMGPHFWRLITTTDTTAPPFDEPTEKLEAELLSTIK